MHIRSTLETNVTATVGATVRRSFPAEPATGTVTGTVTDAATESIVNGTASLGDPDSVLVVDLSSPVNGGIYSITAPGGEYWLWVDAAGYRTRFVEAVQVKAGKTITQDLSLEPNEVVAGVSIPTARGQAALPTYRAAFDPDLTRIATLPGFYTRGSARRRAGNREKLELFDSGGSRLWSSPLSDVSAPAFDVGQWTSTDGGTDVSHDGSLVAVGTAGGTVEVFDAGSGTRLWRATREDDVNPLVPGPLGKGLLRSSEVRFSPDGRSLAAGSLTGFVYLFEASTGNLLWSFPTQGQVRALRFSPKGDKLYVGGGDNFLYVLKTATGALTRRSDLLFWPWEHIGMDRKGRKIVTGGKDGVLRVFNKKGKQLWSRQFPGFIMGYEMSPKGKQVIVNNGATGIYGLTAKGAIAWYRRDTIGIGKLFIDPTGTFVGYGRATTGNGAAGIRVLQLDGTLVWEYLPQGGATSFFNLAFLADGSRLLANNQVDGQTGEVLVFDGWLQSTGREQHR